MRRYRFSIFVLGMMVCLPALLAAAVQATPEPNGPEYVNSIGIKMVRIPAGRFRMGNDQATDQKTLGQNPMLPRGDYDERPVHEVTISRPFYISEVEITAEQYEQFRMDYQEAGRYPPSATGVSWEDAEKFCEWLTAKEHRPYRLPTEAEWEYVARAGSIGLFPTGDTPPRSGEANAFGVKNMNADALEWTADWYGPYTADPQTDPVGPADGWSKVVRGGGVMGPFGESKRRQVDGLAPYYRRSANRASAPAEYHGLHLIGFRIVEGEAPTTAPSPPTPRLWSQFVTQREVPVTAGPDAHQPWFRVRPIISVPPDNALPDAIAASGVDPGLLGHLHAPAVTVCPNGDVFYIAFAALTPETEYLPNTLFVAIRRRFGSDEWDMPDIFFDFADVNDQSALLWTDGRTVQLFTGGSGLAGVPFRWQWSKDNGATWTKPALPVLRGPVGGFSPQPITNAFRTTDGTMYLSSDAVGGHSLLWASHDQGITWQDTGGRTAGRHTAFVVLKDGNILAMGGKNTDIEGYMPAVISRDGGKTWGTPFKTPFPALSSNQRPTLIRLADGRLFFASDWQDHQGKQPSSVTQHGSLVALSSDEGKSWHIKTLAHTLPHEAALYRNRPHWATYYNDYGTIGYSVATQGPDGLIHLISTMTQPSQEFEMNEAWIMSDSTEETPTTAIASGRAMQGSETYSNGKPHAVWTGKLDGSGRYVLDGTGTWYYDNGNKEYVVTYRDGKKLGQETYWAADGKKVWEWQHGTDGVSTWTQYWPNGNRKHESHWRGYEAQGAATAWNPAGQVVGQWQFEKGDVKRDSAPADRP